MRTIYLDKDFCCHVNPDDGLTAVETDFFDGKCDAFVEGYRFVPAGDAWERPDGAVFSGLMITPWKDFRELDEAQREHERQLLAEYEALIDELYAEVSE